MSDEFHKTRMGAKFFEADVPRVIDQLKRIADALETKDTPFCAEPDCEERALPHCARHAMGEVEGGVVVEEVWVVNYMPRNGMLVFATAEAAADHMIKDLPQATRREIVEELEKWKMSDKAGEDDWVLAVGRYEVHRATVQL